MQPQGVNTEQVPNPLIKWSLALNALLIAVLVTLVLMRNKSVTKSRHPQSEQDSAAQLDLKQKLKVIEIEAKHNNLPKLRDAILSWGKSLFPELVTLKQLANLLDDDQLQDLLQQLDHQLYDADNEGALDTVALLEILKRHTSKAGVGQYNITQQRGLKSLYPQ